MNNLVLITSVIKTPNLALSYTETRSVFTSEERFEQTKKTIQTMKEKIPNSKIFIVECSELNEEQNDYLIKNSDYFLNLYDNSELRKNIYGRSKSLGEGTMTIAALEYIINNNINYDNLIKISGRYWLSDNFLYSNFENDNIVIKYINNDSNNVLTALYKLPKVCVEKLKDFLIKNIYKMFACIGYEVLFSEFINGLSVSKNILDTIGIQGYVSVSKDYYNG
jgi:hypothetical protein